MSIQAVGGASAAQQFQQVRAASQSESGEIPGKPDHDGDADDSSATSVSPTDASAMTAPGTLNVHA